MESYPDSPQEAYRRSLSSSPSHHYYGTHRSLPPSHHPEESFLRTDHEGAYDSGNFSGENLEGSSSPQPSFPMFSVGSPALRRTSSGRGQRNGVNLGQTLSTPELSSITHKSNAAAQVSELINKSGPDSYLHHLVSNFNTLYEEKLKETERHLPEVGEGDRHFGKVERQNAIMKDWVRDLNEQNSVLIETVNEMEREAEEKIQLLQTKMQRSTQLVMEHMEVIQGYERQVQDLLDQRMTSDKEFEMLRSEALVVDQKRKNIEEKMTALELDHDNLVTLMTRIRDWGVWDINGLLLDPKTYYQLFGLYPSLPGSEVQTVFTQERAREVRETESKLANLEVQFENLQKQITESAQQLTNKDVFISHLQHEREELQNNITRAETEKEEYKTKLEETKDLLTQSVMSANAIPRVDLTAHDAEMNELIKELRTLKNELNVACTERQNAMLEASSLKSEMAQRLLEMTQMKNLLMSIQAETETTRGKVQDVQEKQDQLATLQEQVKLYQEKYEGARAMLNNKCDMIQNLQEQMDLLHEKVSRIELVKSTPDVPLRTPPLNVIHAPVLPPRRRAEEKLRALQRQPDSLRFTAKGLDKAGQALKELERQNREDEASADSLRSLHGSNLSADKPPWNEYFYSRNTSNSLLKETLGPEASALPAPAEKVHYEKKKPLPFSVRYPKRIQPAQAPQIGDTKGRSRSVDAKKMTIPPVTNRRSQSKVRVAKAIEFAKANKHVLGHKMKSEPVTSPRTSRPSLKSARHEKIAQYFSERFGINIDEIPNLRPESRKAHGKDGGTRSGERAKDQAPKHKVTERPHIQRKKDVGKGQDEGLHLPAITNRPSSKRDKESKNSKTREAKYDDFHLPRITDLERPVSRQSRHSEGPKNRGDGSVELPRLVERPSTREEKLSSLPSGGLGYIPSTDPYELKKLEALVHAAVTTSKQLINSFDPSQGNVRMRVTASHRRHLKATKTTFKHEQPKSSSPDEEEELDDTLSDPPNATTLEESSEERLTGPDMRPQALQALRRKTEKLAKPYDPKKSLPKAPEDILASLPIESQERVVQNWIIKNGFAGEEVSGSSGSVSVLKRSHHHCVPPKSGIKSCVKRVSYRTRTHRPPPMDNAPKREAGQKSKETNNNNLHNMGRDIDHWVSSKKTVDSSETDESFDKSLGQGEGWYHNNNVNPSRHQNVTLESNDSQAVQELHDRILTLESQVKSKDTLLQSLECELEVEKSAKKTLQSEMDSKKAEITMQKTCLEVRSGFESEEGEGQFERELRRLMQNEAVRGQFEFETAAIHREVVSEKAGHRTRLVHENDTLTKRKEVMEKNILLYQCFGLLTKIESDYIQDPLGTENGYLDQRFNYNELETAHDTESEISRMLVLIKGSKLENILNAIVSENKELKKRIADEERKAENLRNELTCVKQKARSRQSHPAMATQIQSLISSLEGENNKLKSELRDVATNAAMLVGTREDKMCQSSASEFIAKFDVERKDKIIRLQGQQISKFEEYVERLHDEIRQWVYLTTKRSASTSDTSSIVRRLQENIENFEQIEKAKAAQHERLVADMKKMKEKLLDSTRREMELDCENNMLKQTVGSLMERVSDLVKSFEDLKYKHEEQQFGYPTQEQSVLWGSHEFPDFCVPVLTSTPTPSSSRQRHSAQFFQSNNNVMVSDSSSEYSFDTARKEKSTTDLKKRAPPTSEFDGGRGDTS